LEEGMALGTWLFSPLLAEMAGLSCTARGCYERKLHWTVNEETGKGECERLGHNSA